MTVRSYAVPLATIATLGLSALTLAPQTAYAQVTPGTPVAEGQIITEVEIRGTKNTNPQVAKLAAAGAGIAEGQPFKNDAFTAARQKIREVGLYGSVYGRTEQTADGKCKVIFEVIENQVITEIVITGNKSLKSKDLLPKLETQPGNVLNTETLDKDLLKIQKEYQDKGYRAFVTNEISIDPKTGILTIPIQETIVEDIIVEGNKKTKSFVITREMKTKVGDPLNFNKLRDDLGRILNLGLFADVSDARLDDGSDLGRVKLILPVQEQRTGQVGVVFGYSVRQRLTGTLELSEQNFQGKGQAVNLSWTVGGISAANQFEIGFTEPWLDNKHTSLSVNVYNRFAYRFNRVLSSNYTDGTNSDQYYEERQGGSIALARPISDTTRLIGIIRTEKVKANNLEANYDSLTPDQINSIRGALVQNGNVSSLTLRSNTDTRDFNQDPAKGYFFSPTVEFGTGSFDYEDPRANPAFIDDATTPNEPRALVTKRTQNGTFTKFNIDYRNYYSLSGKRTKSLREPKMVLATRLQLGTSGGNIGFSEQYFMGGADNLRGYADDRFWGNNLFLFSSELRVPFDKKSGTLTGVLFMDIGDAWGATDVNREDIDNFKQHKNFKPNVGFGLGIRVKTPVGPVRLDYGIGEQSRTHFSIGQAF